MLENTQVFVGKFLSLADLMELFDNISPSDIHKMDLSWCKEKYKVFRAKVLAGHLKDEVLFDPKKLVFDYSSNLHERMKCLGENPKHLAEYLLKLGDLPKFKRVDKRMSSSSFHHLIPGGMKIAKEDIDKFFVITDNGPKIITQDEISNMNPDQIDVWYHIGCFDIDDIRDVLSRRG